MNTSYKHLSTLEREKLMILLHTGLSQAEIARQIGRHPATISRELRRHNLDNYSAQCATESYQRHRLHCKAHKKLANPKYRQLVEDKILKQQWSPEQLSHRLKKEKSELSISYTTIYRAFNAGMFDIRGRKAARHLRHRGKTRKHNGYEERRGKIQISHPLEARPRSAERRSRLGDWELDTVLGKAGKACLMTANDRKSRFTIVKKLPNKGAKAMAEALIEAFDGHHLRSLTPDRGKEFARHTDVTSVLGFEFYFPEPHQPWQRGTNENTNGLLREYFPKQQDISPWNDDEIQAVVDKLNLRPRKCLGWKTPYEVYFSALGLTIQEQYRKAHLTDEEHRALQNALLINPEKEDLIQGAGGLRKIRIVDSKRNKGKRGGARVIYYWHNARSHIVFFTAYGKDVKDDLSQDERQILANLLTKIKATL